MRLDPVWSPVAVPSAALTVRCCTTLLRVLGQLMAGAGDVHRRMAGLDGLVPVVVGVAAAIDDRWAGRCPCGGGLPRL